MVKAYSKELIPLIIATVMTVEQDTGIRIIKHRLSLWEVSVKPILKVLFDNKIRKVVFSRGGPYNRTRQDILRWVYSFMPVYLTSGIMAVLVFQIYKTIGLLGIPWMVQLPAGMFIGIVVAAAVILLWPLILKGMREGLEKKISDISKEKTTEEQKQEMTAKAVNNFKTTLMILSALQLVVILAALLFLPSLLNTPFIVMLPKEFRFFLFLAPILIFISTWRLTFYSMNYFTMLVGEWAENWRNNVYEVVKNSDISKMKTTLLYLLIDDDTNGYFAHRQKRRQERADSFNILLKHLSSGDEYYYNLPAGTQITEDEMNDKHLLERKIDRILQDASRTIEVGGYKIKHPQHAVQTIREWINDEFRTDKADELRSWDAVLPLTVSIQGFTEEAYFALVGKVH
jgi:hypothetical protein